MTFQAIGTGRSSDKAAEREQEAFKLKTYKSALALLPKAQVTISPQAAKRPERQMKRTVSPQPDHRASGSASFRCG